MLEGKKIAYCHLEPLTAQSAGPIFAVGTCRGLYECGLSPVLLVPKPEAENKPPFEIKYFSSTKVKVGPFRLTWGDRRFQEIESMIELDKNICCLITRDFKLGLFIKKYLPHLPLIYEVHDFYGDLKKKWQEKPREKGKLKREKKLAKLEPKMFKVCDGVLFLRETTQKIFSEYYNLPPHVVASTGCDKIPDVGVPPKSKVVAHIGRLYPDKGADIALEAIAACKDARLRIVGEGPEKPILQQRAEKLGIEERVEFYGWVQHERLQEALKDVRAVVLSQLDTFFNRYLTSPKKAFDAISYGIPLIFPDLPCIVEFLEDEKHGLAFKTEDSKDLACAIEKLVSDDELWSKLASNLPELARKFSWVSRAEKISSFLETVIYKKGERIG